LNTSLCWFEQNIPTLPPDLCKPKHKLLGFRTLQISAMPEKIAEKGQSEVGTHQSGSAFLTTLISAG